MPSSGIFISYRREDAAGHAGWLRDGLTAHFGEDQVFMDLGLEPGVDFVEQIEAGISGCAALLVVIGEEWLTTTGADGRRRLDDEGDFVRLEVATALARPGLRVVPILVQDARMPVAKELPEDLEPLARRQAIELSNERWKFDVGRLIGTLERVLAAHAASIGQQPDRSEESATDQSPVQPDQPASDESATAGTLPAGAAGEAPPEEMSPEGTLAALTVAEEASSEETPSEEDAPRGPGPGADPPEHTPPDEELADDTPTHVAAPPRALHPRRRPAIAAGAVAVLVLTVLVVAVVIGGGATGDDGGNAVAGGGAENVVAELTAGSGPDDIALDARSVWVTEDDRGKLARISRATGQVLTEDLDVGADADGVDTGAGTVWAVSTGENRVTQFQPGAATPLAQIDVESGPKGIAVGPEDVWVVNSEVDKLTRIGLPEAKVTQVIPVGDDPREVTLGARGIVWVANVKDRSVTRIDLDGDPREHIAVGGRPRDIAKDTHGYIWVAIADGDEVVRIGPRDAAGERAMERIAVGARPSGLAVSDGIVWVTNFDANTVSLIDEQSLDPVGDPIPVGKQPGAIAAEGDTAWVTNYGDDTVSKITVASAGG